MNYQNLIHKYPILTDQISERTLRTVLHQLQATLDQGVDGDIVEFGCYSGTTSLFLQRVLLQQSRTAARTLHVYDSFAGLPPKTTADESDVGQAFQAGALKVSKKAFIRNFMHANLPLPTIHKGWFSDLCDTDVPERIAFGFLDGDFYASIMTSLELVWSHVSNGGTLCIDDYGREALPGVSRAVQKFFHGTSIVIQQREHIAIIKKRASL